MASTLNTGTITVSDQDARGAVTGQNVRYVLGYGLIGVVAAFIAIPLYLGFDTVQAAIANTDLAALATAALPYLALVIAGSVLAMALIAVVRKFAGDSDNATQSGMRLRIVLQFAAICVVLGTLLIEGRA
jgi:hypothetical protein